MFSIFNGRRSVPYLDRDTSASISCIERTALHYIEMKKVSLVFLVFTCNALFMSNVGERLDGEMKMGDNWKLSFILDEKLRWRQRATEIVEFTIDASKIAGNITTFWKSTGLCPPDPHQEVCSWLHSPSMLHNLALIGALPHSSIQQVRVHWLLDAVKITEIRSNEITYNFTCLDDFIDNLYSNGLFPGFEVMGNPSNHFSNFEDPLQIIQWKDFIHKLASHYIAYYGVYYVSKWNFESWNEPKPHAFDGLNMTRKGFLNYYDATAEGLRQASPKLRFGGPGGECPNKFDAKSYCWALLDHAANGINYFTGKKDVKLDFISIHKKGDSPANVATMIEKEQKFLSLLRLHLPSVANTDIYNDESDPLVGWSVDRQWQADVTYAAMAAKAIAVHVQNNVSDIRLMSNDNAFLSYQPYPFTQRTLLARFQVNTTSPPHIQFIRKPIYSVMGLLSLLGDQLVLVTSSSDEKFSGDPGYLKNLSVIATLHQPTPAAMHDNWQIGIVIYFSKDTVVDHSQAEVSVVIQNLPGGQELAYVVYVLDNLQSNPFATWKTSGSPATPNTTVFQEMRSFEEPVRLFGPAVWPVSDRGHITLPLIHHPSIALLHLCAETSDIPNQVTNVVVYNITFGQVLVVWDDSCVSSKCIKTYEVEFSTVNLEDRFHRINPRDTFFTSFVSVAVQPMKSRSNHNSSSKGASLEPTRGFYRVRAIDYWNRPGPYSLVTSYPS